MSSTNDHLLPPPKPKLSPLEFRNTDLVSRLLAATPPYLYNMSLLPNTYFFSEMLRSLVQAKNEQHRINSLHPPFRRSRKRTWAQHRNDFPANETTKHEPPEPWMIKSNKKTPEERENPLALTTKLENNQIEDVPQQPIAKLETSSLENNLTSFQNHCAQQENQSVVSPGLVLPPPPPMWYPPIYPTPPYGIDPLHFFIDLRVSGHIYDRKHQREGSASLSSTTVSPRDEITTEETELKSEEITEGNFGTDFLKQRRHCSAFSVPNNNNKNNLMPMNLISSDTKTKFDVKSLGFDRSINATSTSYVMKNITSIYKNVDRQKNIFDDEQHAETNVAEEQRENDESDEERQKKVKDLQALIGLELVVDYMKHKKPSVQNVINENVESNSSDVESVGSPTLEVVALQDDN